MENAPSPSLEASLLQRWFPVTRVDRPTTTQLERFSETDLRDISDVLRRLGYGTWSRVPRIYVVLRRLDRLDVIDLFIAQDISDVYFPFTLHTLPQSLIPSVAHEFLQAQRVVLSSALDLERETGRHRHFSSTNDVPFIKVEELGKGAYGYVDRVSSTISHREYARKLIPRGRTFQRNQTVLREFERELGTLKKLCHHRHIVRLIGSYTDPRYVGILMSPVADCDLKDFLSSCDSSDVSIAQSQKSFARSFFGCLTSALSYLHDNTIRHKDIKPQNVLVAQHTVYLTDFGISLDWSEMGKETTTGPTPKTARYCAPEVSDYAPRNTSSDMWSLGCIMLEIWTVLKGEPVENMYAFLEANGTSSSCYHLNQEAVVSWMGKLQSKPTSADNAPLSWLRHLLVQEKQKRWTARQLFNEIEVVNNDPATKFAFCGQCCMDEFEGTESVISSSGSFDDLVNIQDGLPGQSALKPSTTGLGDQQRSVIAFQSPAVGENPGREALMDDTLGTLTPRILLNLVRPSEESLGVSDKIDIAVDSHFVNADSYGSSTEELIRRQDVFSSADCGSPHLGASTSDDIILTHDEPAIPQNKLEQDHDIDEVGSNSQTDERGLKQNLDSTSIASPISVSLSMTNPPGFKDDIMIAEAAENMPKQLKPELTQISPTSGEIMHKATATADLPAHMISTDSPIDRITLLETTMEDLRKRRISVHRNLEDANIVECSNPLNIDFRSARLAKQRKHALEEELSEIKREEHDVGLKLHRAWKKRDSEGPSRGPNNLRIRRQRDPTESGDLSRNDGVREVAAAAVRKQDENQFFKPSKSTENHNAAVIDGGAREADSGDLPQQRGFSFKPDAPQSLLEDVDSTLVTHSLTLQPIDAPSSPVVSELPATELLPLKPATSTAGSRKYCGICKEALAGQFVRALSDTFHLQCFTCADCGIIVASKFFPVPGEIRNGKQTALSNSDEGHATQVVLCETDYFRRLDLLCYKCGLGLRGSYITALGRKYHLEHFTCDANGCDTTFEAHDSYYEHNGETLCEIHYRHRADICHGCGIWIYQEYVELCHDNDLYNQRWHPDCYMIHKYWGIDFKNEFANSITKRKLPMRLGAMVSETTLRSSMHHTRRVTAMIWSVMAAFEESCAASITSILLATEPNGLQALSASGYLVLKIEILLSAIDQLDMPKEAHKRNREASIKEQKALCKKIAHLFRLIGTGLKTQSRELSELLSDNDGIPYLLKLVIKSGLDGAVQLDPHGNEASILTFLMHVETATNAKIQERLRDEYYFGRNPQVCTLCQAYIGDKPGQGFYWTHKQLFHIDCITCPSCNGCPTVVKEPRSKPYVECTHCNFGNMMPFVAGNFGGGFVLLHTELLLIAHLLWVAWYKIATLWSPKLDGSPSALIRALPPSNEPGPETRKGDAQEDNISTPPPCPSGWTAHWSKPAKTYVFMNLQTGMMHWEHPDTGMAFKHQTNAGVTTSNGTANNDPASLEVLPGLVDPATHIRALDHITRRDFPERVGHESEGAIGNEGYLSDAKRNAISTRKLDVPKGGVSMSDGRLLSQQLLSDDANAQDDFSKGKSTGRRSGFFSKWKR